MIKFREDKGQFLNLPLINTLRDNGGRDYFGVKDASGAKTTKNAGDEESQGKEGNNGIETIPNPPNFYQADIDKWHKRFQKHISERDQFKRRYMKQSEITCLTRNTNIKEAENEAPAATKKAGSVGADTAKPSLFGKVLKRRMSR
jgi:hypothetical protein